MLKIKIGLFALLGLFLFVSCENSNEIENKKPEIIELYATLDTLGFNKVTDVYCVVNDEDEEFLSYEWIASGGVISGEGNKITWKSPSEAGQYKILCNVRDGEFIESSHILIEVINEIPLMINLEASSELLEVGGVTELTSYATDNYGNLKYEWIVDQGEIVGNGNKVKWIAPNTVGSFQINCKVTNIHGESVTGKLEIKTKTTPIYFYAGDGVYSCNTDGTEFRYLTNGSYQFFYNENTLMYRDRYHNIKTLDINLGTIKTIHRLNERTVYHYKIPDKEILVFYFHKSNGERDLGTFNLETKSFNYIYNKNNNQIGAVANIDNWIYFLDGSHSGDSEYKINRITLDGYVDPNFEKRENGYSYSHFSITVDGDKIYSAKRGTKNYIAIIDINTLNEKLIEITEIETLSYVHVSKDEDYILFVGINGSDRNIYKINIDGSNLVKVTNQTNLGIARPLTWNHF